MKKVLVSFLAFFTVFVPYLELQLPKSAEAQAASNRDPVVRNFFERDTLPSANDIFSLVNEERRDKGLEELIPSQLLMEIAEARAADMQQNNYYAHKSPEGLYYYDLLTGSSYENTYSCENLDLRFDTAADRYVRDWLNSPAHKKCLLNPTSTRAGYAVMKMQSSVHGEDLPAYVVVAIHAAE